MESNTEKYDRYETKNLGIDSEYAGERGGKVPVGSDEVLVPAT